MEDRHRERQSKLHNDGSRDCGIAGMESVVATVSGYHGSERFNLIKLINHTGANYVGTLSESITHLVCWELGGSKYKLARKLGTKIVSHRWFEDCERERKRLPERPYLMQSGKQVGPLSWEPPVAGPIGSILARKNDTFFYDRSNICNDARTTEIENEFREPSFHLSSEMLFSDLGKENKNSHKGKKTMSMRISKQDSRSSKDCFLEEQFSGAVREQHGESSSYASFRSRNQKRSVCSASGSTPRVEPTRKSRRLEKKNASRDIKKQWSPTENFDEVNTTTAESNDSDDLRSDNSLTILNCEQECSPNGNKVEHTRKSRRLVKKNASRDMKHKWSPTEDCDEVNTTTAASNDSDDLRRGNSLTILDCEQEYSLNENNQRNINAPSNDSNGLRNDDPVIPQGLTSQDSFHISENRIEELEDIEDITELNNVAASNGSNILSDDVLLSQERMSPTGSDFEDVDGVLKDVVGSRTPERLPTSTDLSCVICWTDFSSTRGVLTCGHRFCYTCIRDWADHMASRRKVSTCPLCKASFVSITKVEDAATSDQKIYSQTIPYASSAAKDIFVLSDWEVSGTGGQFSAPSVCCVCHSQEPEDLLVSCHLCRNHWVHSYCLDPPLDPWTCINCRRLRMLYRRIH